MNYVDVAIRELQAFADENDDIRFVIVVDSQFGSPVLIKPKEGIAFNIDYQVKHALDCVHIPYTMVDSCTSGDDSVYSTVLLGEKPKETIVVVNGSRYKLVPLG